jgi:hypothetical protein
MSVHLPLNPTAPKLSDHAGQRCLLTPTHAENKWYSFAPDARVFQTSISEYLPSCCTILLASIQLLLHSKPLRIPFLQIPQLLHQHLKINRPRRIKIILIPKRRLGLLRRKRPVKRVLICPNSQHNLSHQQPKHSFSRGCSRPLTELQPMADSAMPQSREPERFCLSRSCRLCRLCLCQSMAGSSAPWRSHCSDASAAACTPPLLRGEARRWNDYRVKGMIGGVHKLAS